MNDEQDFLQAMLQSPSDTFLRLVFADWLEERGDSRGVTAIVTCADAIG